MIEMLYQLKGKEIMDNPSGDFISDRFDYNCYLCSPTSPCNLLLKEENAQIKR
jgi:hypothetical protein